MQDYIEKLGNLWLAGTMLGNGYQKMKQVLYKRDREGVMIPTDLGYI